MNNTRIATCETASGAAGEASISTAHFLINGARRPIRLELEGCNPAGSMKDRTAACFISGLESPGILKSSSIIVESTSGNLEVGLACSVKNADIVFWP